MADVLDGPRLLFCCVDTPPTYSGDADLSRVQAVVAALPDDDTARAGDEEHRAGRHRRGDPSRQARPRLRLVPRVPQGGHRRQRLPASRPGRDRRRSGRGMGGATCLPSIYAPLGGEIVRTDVASAEMIKLASNAFLATKISFINEIANVCEGVGADVTEVARGMGLDARIGPHFLQAGSDSADAAFPKTRRPSSSSPATPATTSSC